MSQPKRTPQATPSGHTRLACRKRTKAGAPCQAAARPSGYCWRHDPALREKRKAAERNGGRTRAYTGGERVEVKTLEDVRLQLCKVLGALWAMDNTIARARAIVAVCAELRGTLVVGDLEARLSRLEAILEASGGATP
ncbi:MAG: hypothetical protein FJZ97_13290 [Chloroflexi bacterium]|nr:hypothetical protein [Chloroflexota bacterium]